jgi:hypothetical protein
MSDLYNDLPSWLHIKDAENINNIRCVSADLASLILPNGDDVYGTVKLMLQSRVGSFVAVSDIQNYIISMLQSGYWDGSKDDIYKIEKAVCAVLEVADDVVDGFYSKRANAEITSSKISNLSVTFPLIGTLDREKFENPTIY